MPRRALILILLAAQLALAEGCAGPATPLGGVWAVTPAQARPQSGEMAEARRHQGEREGPRIGFWPVHQVLHAPSPMKVLVSDNGARASRDYGLLMYYDGLDVSRSFLSRSSVSFDARRGRLEIQHPRISLSASRDHFIEVAYRSPAGRMAYARYESPSCQAFRPSRVMRLGEFASHLRLARLIERISEAKGLNPAFATGLVAEESGFNPKAVSWAKALGLTQITPVADAELTRTYSSWPRYPGLNELPVTRVRELVESGEVNAGNEWRLDQELSVSGGLQYALSLANRWSEPAMLSKIRALFPDPEATVARLTLASYNSGYSRVASALERRGTDWIEDPELAQARIYVNKIFSYCDFFADKEYDL